mgnify:CR=1 FL=1
MKSTSEPLVSIIMNCYNGEKFLREAIDSVYAQTYQNWEIIFWDNASTDSSAAIVKSYDKKIKYFKSFETTLLGEARVQATGMAKGEYFAFLDVDDIWTDKEKLEKQIALFIEEGSIIGLVYGRTEVLFDNSKKNGFIIKNGEKLLDGDIFSELAKDNFIVFSSAMVNKDKFFNCGGFPKHFFHSTDYWIFMRMAQKYECGVIQDVCCKYRIHTHNLSAEYRVVAAQESIETLKNLSLDKDVIIGINHQYANLALLFIKERKILESIQVIIKHKITLIILSRIIKKIKKLLD